MTKVTNSMKIQSSRNDTIFHYYYYYNPLTRSTFKPGQFWIRCVQFVQFEKRLKFWSSISCRGQTITTPKFMRHTINENNKKKIAPKSIFQYSMFFLLIQMVRSIDPSQIFGLCVLQMYERFV